MVHRSGTKYTVLSSTGYLPITEKAFGDVMTKEIDNISDET